MPVAKDIVTVIRDHLPEHYASLEGSTHFAEVLSYVHHRDMPTDAVVAILELDLVEAASYGRERPKFWAEIPLIIQYLYNWAPRSCYGSAAKVEAWLEAQDHTDYTPRFVYEH